MKNKFLAVLTFISIISISVNALSGNGVFKINTLPDSLLPLFRYNMNVALFKGSKDSVYLVNIDGDIIFKGPKTTNIMFNSNLDFYGVNEVGDPLLVRNDLNLDGVYPIVISDYIDRSPYTIDYKGHVVIEKGKYDYISYFVDGYARVSKDDKWGIIDVNSNEVVPLSAPDDYHFFINHNIWQFFESDSKWHMIDNHGKDVCSFDQVTHNYNTAKLLVEKNFKYYMKNRDLGISVVRKGDKWGAVDKSGKIVIPLVNERPSAVYKCEDGRWIYGGSVFDQNGNLIFKQNDYQTSTTVEFGTILTEKMEQKENSYSLIFGLYDSKGNKTDYVQVSKNKRWHLMGNKWTLEDNKGKIISGPYEDVEFKHDCPAKDFSPWIGDKADEFFKVVDTEKARIIQNGKFKIVHTGKAGLIDKNGKFILPMKYSDCNVDHNALECSNLEDSIRHIAFYDFKGKEIQPMILHKRLAVENFGWHYEGTDCTLDAYQVNDKWGLLDMETKKIVVPFCLDDVLAFMHGVGVVKYKGRLYYINEKGEGLPKEAYMTK